MSAEEAPGQKRRCFPEILDLIFRLSDGAWRMLLYVANVTQVSQLQFAALSTHTIISAAKSVLQRCVPSLIGPAGMDIVLMEEGLLRKRVESVSVSPAGPSTSADSTGPSSSTSAERCTNDASGGVERLHHPTASRALWNIPALNTGSAMLIRSPHRKVFQLHFDSCTDTVTRNVVEIHKSELLVSSSSKVCLLISIFLQKRPAVKVTTVKPQGFITSNMALNRTYRSSGEMEDPLALLVNSEQAKSERINDVGAGSAMLIRSPHRKVFQLHFDSCTDTATRKVVEIHKSELLVSSSSKVCLLISIFLQKRPAVKVTTVKPQGFITSNMALNRTYRSSEEMEDPLALLVNSEQAESERINDVSICDVTSPGASPPPSSKAGSETVRDTLENRSTSSQETSSSSSSPLNDREPEVVRKRSHGLHFFVGRKAPFISFGQKKSTKAGPAGVESGNHQADSGNHQQSPQRESTAAPFKKTRKRLSRMFSAVCKALPN
ncbi:hypothetical protein MHYP_G00106480, partial [Metynnis hypsauchen]